MTEIEKHFADREEQDYRDLLGRYSLGWASEPVRELAPRLTNLDLLDAVGIAQKLTAGKKGKRKYP